MTLYVVFGILLVAILAAVLMPSNVAQAMKDYMKTLPHPTGLSPHWVRRMTYIGVWLLLLFTLWLFREEVPLWDLWRANGKFFWMSQLVIVVVALTWSMNRWTKTVNVALVITLLWVMGDATNRHHPGFPEVMSPTAYVATRDERAPAASKRTELTVTARQGKWSVVEIPPSHDFEVYYRGTTRVCVNRDAKGCHQEFVRPDVRPISYGYQVHKLEFMAEEDPEVKVKVVHWPV